MRIRGRPAGGIRQAAREACVAESTYRRDLIRQGVQRRPAVKAAIDAAPVALSGAALLRIARGTNEAEMLAALEAEVAVRIAPRPPSEAERLRARVADLEARIAALEAENARLQHPSVGNQRALWARGRKKMTEDSGFTQEDFVDVQEKLKIYAAGTLDPSVIVINFSHLDVILAALDIAVRQSSATPPPQPEWLNLKPGTLKLPGTEITIVLWTDGYLSIYATMREVGLETSSS